MHTKELYYEDAYIRSFSATVIESNTFENGGISLVLDKTAFFPESGGQSSDKGTLGNYIVTHVEIKDGIISHVCKPKTQNTDIPKVGDSICGEIDFDYRFSNMQQHTGEHIFSGIVKKLFGYENVGFHLSDNTVTMDYDGPLTDEDVSKVETLTNEAIFKNMPITASFPTKDELKNIDYRAKLDAETMGTVRLVTIGDLDICACCAPHVAHTGEVGILKVIDHINYKGGIRLTIACGKRAYEDYLNKSYITSELSHKLSVPASEIITAIDKQKNDLIMLKEQLSQTESLLLEEKIRYGHKDTISSVPCCIIFCEIGDKNLLRNRVTSLMDEYGYVLCFNGNDDKGYSFLIGSKKYDAKTLVEKLATTLSIKGGGKNPLIQGQVTASKSEILSMIKSLD